MTLLITEDKKIAGEEAGLCLLICKAIIVIIGIVMVSSMEKQIKSFIMEDTIEKVTQFKIPHKSIHNINVVLLTL